MILDITKIAHHNKVDPDHKWGYQIRMVNEPEYCGKLLVLENEERGGFHYHEQKKETFIVLSGQIVLAADNLPQSPVVLFTGAHITIQPMEKHWMQAQSFPAVILEVSTHDDDEDTYYV